MKLSDLKPAPYNPRAISPEAFAALGVSLATFGDISGIVYNVASERLVAGHQRVKALQGKYGDLEIVRTEPEVGYIDIAGAGAHESRLQVRFVHWDEQTEKAANIAANSPHLSGGFTDDLAPLLRELDGNLPAFEELRFNDLLSIESLDDSNGSHGTAAPPRDPSETWIGLKPADLRACFPYFGGKSKVAWYVWERFGSPKHYIEPFCGSAAVLLAKPGDPCSLEVVNDLNCYIANFWRAVRYQPDETWAASDYQVSHIDLYARHRWLTEPKRTEALRAALLDPDWPGDPKIAGWWVWGQCCWIGSGWCEEVNREATPHQQRGKGSAESGLEQLPHIGDAGRGLDPHRWLCQLSDRLGNARIICGSWERCLNHHYGGESTAVFIDPPYIHEGDALYDAAGKQSEAIAKACEAWARDNAELRICLCGHIGDYDLPGWDVVRWRRAGFTYAGSGTTDSEALWFSPGCLPHPQTADD